MAKDLVKQDDFDFGFELSDMMMMIMMIVMISVVSTMSSTTAAQAAQTTQALQAQAYEGRSDPRTVLVTPLLGWLDFVNNFPFAPWVGAYIINDGPSTVGVGINSPANMIPMGPGETITIDRSGAQERISTMFFICTTGPTSTLRITGEY